MRTSLRWPWLAAALLVSCVGTDVGNPPDDERTVIAALEFATYEPEADESGSTADSAPAGESSRALIVDGSTDITSLWLSIDSVVVTPAEDCRPESERVIAGPFYVDLLGGEVYPSPPILTEVPEAYCAIRLQLAPAKEVPAEAPAALTGNSLWLEGATEAGTGLSIALDAKRRLNYAAEDFVVDGDDGERLRFITAFEPGGWLDEVDVSAANPIEIDEMRSAAELAAFWSAFAAGSRVVFDENDDGRVDNDEFQRPVAIPRTPQN